MVLLVALGSWTCYSISGCGSTELRHGFGAFNQETRSEYFLTYIYILYYIFITQDDNHIIK